MSIIKVMDISEFLTMQEHLFTSPSLNRLTSQLRRNILSTVGCCCCDVTLSYAFFDQYKSNTQFKSKRFCFKPSVSDDLQSVGRTSG